LRASPRRFGPASVLLAALLAAACATAPPPAPPAPAPSGTAAAVPVPAVKVSVPEAVAPSGVLYRVGLKSDATELTVGAAGTLWIVASGDRAELVQAPIVFRPAGPAGPGAAPGPRFQVQAGAFS